MIEQVGARDVAIATRLYTALAGAPFAAHVLDDARVASALALSERIGAPGGMCVEALRPLEPHVPWTLEVLTSRRDCYLATGDPRSTEAIRDVERFMLCPTAEARLTCW